jgi:PAS domain-containing protein
VNAIEAMSAVDDRPRLLTIVSRHDSPTLVLVEVRDTGSGIDPQRIEQMFEAFYTTKADGIGIGLSISRSIVEAHGGRLWASTNEPHGAVFRLTLPVAPRRDTHERGGLMGGWVRRGYIRRYGLALALGVIAPARAQVASGREGTTVYQLPLVAVVLAGWYGGRGPAARLGDLLDRRAVLAHPSRGFVRPVGGIRDRVLIFVALCLFITEFSAARWRVERALEESERRFRLMAETIPEIVWIESVMPRLMLYMSPRYEQVWGRPLGDVEQRPGSLDGGCPSGAQERRAIRVETLAGGRRQRAARHDIPHRPARRRHTLDPQPRHLDPRRAGKTLPRQRHRRGHHRRKARARGAGQGADGAGARVAAHDAGRADDLDRPRGQPAARRE